MAPASGTATQIIPFSMRTGKRISLLLSRMITRPDSALNSQSCRMHVPQPLGIDLGRLPKIAFEFANEVRQARVTDAVCGLAHIGPAQQESTCLLHTQLFQEL